MVSMDEAYRAHSETIHRYLLSLTRDGQLAEELTQETFYQAVKSADRFDGSCKVTTWLCAIAKNSLAVYRRKHPLTAELDEQTPAACSPEDEVMSGAGQLEIMRKLHEIEGDAREVLYLRLFGDLSFRDIGDIFSKTENWARVTFYRGKERLKKELENNEK